MQMSNVIEFFMNNFVFIEFFIIFNYVFRFSCILNYDSNVHIVNKTMKKRFKKNKIVQTNSR